MVAAYGQIGKPSYDATAAAGSSAYPLVLTTFRHTEHFQGGPMTRNVPWLIELVPEAVVEINSADAAAIGIADGDLVEIATMRSPMLGPWRAVVNSGPSASQKVAVGTVAVPWHWGSAGLATGPTANELTIDALDGNTNMPETKACLCNIRKKT